VPISEFNRCLGLGVGADVTQQDLDHALAWLDRHAAPNYAIQLPPLDAAATIAGWLERRGLQPNGTGWARFYRPAGPAHETPSQTDLTVRPLSPGEGWHFGSTMVDGFGLAAVVGPWFAALVGRPGWHIYVAYDQGIPAGCGALYTQEGWGWMGCDTTLLEYRGRGAQAALIQRRVADAMAMGITALAAETGQPAPGMEHSSPSYRNYAKAGFVKAYVRPNFRRS